jgi:hypothetical protein
MTVYYNALTLIGLQKHYGEFWRHSQTVKVTGGEDGKDLAMIFTNAMGLERSLLLFCPHDRAKLCPLTTAINPMGFQFVAESYGHVCLSLLSQSSILSLSSFIFWASTFIYSPQLKDDFGFAIATGL